MRGVEGERETGKSGGRWTGDGRRETQGRRLERVAGCYMRPAGKCRAQRFAKSGGKGCAVFHPTLRREQEAPACRSPEANLKRRVENGAAFSTRFRPRLRLASRAPSLCASRPPSSASPISGNFHIRPASRGLPLIVRDINSGRDDAYRPPTTAIRNQRRPSHHAECPA